MSTDEWITINEAAAKLQTNRVKIWRLMKEGLLVARENPLDRRERLIHLSEVEQLALLGRRKPSGKGPESE